MNEKEYEILQLKMQIIAHEMTLYILAGKFRDILARLPQHEKLNLLESLHRSLRIRAEDIRNIAFPSDAAMSDLQAAEYQKAFDSVVLYFEKSLDLPI